MDVESLNHRTQREKKHWLRNWRTNRITQTADKPFVRRKHPGSTKILDAAFWLSQNGLNHFAAYIRQAKIAAVVPEG